jgi:hypothetical protein
MISKEHAIEAAKKKLDEIQVDYTGRDVSASQQHVYKVVFPPPPNMRAGDFTLFIDSETGEVLAMRLER